jgi:hypothetical protein
MAGWWCGGRSVCRCRGVRWRGWFRHEHGDGFVFVVRPRATFLPQTMITTELLARRCTRTGSTDGRGGGPGPWPAGCAGRGAVRGGEVVEHQHARFDTDPDPADRRGSTRDQDVSGQGYSACAGHDPLDLDHVAALALGWGTGVDRAVGEEPRASCTVRCERTVLILACRCARDVRKYMYDPNLIE